MKYRVLVAHINLPWELGCGNIIAVQVVKTFTTAVKALLTQNNMGVLVLTEQKPKRKLQMFKYHTELCYQTQSKLRTGAGTTRNSVLCKYVTLQKLKIFSKGTYYQ